MTKRKQFINTGYDVLLNTFSYIDKNFKDIPAGKQILPIKGSIMMARRS